MKDCYFFAAGSSAALSVAVNRLVQDGCIFLPKPCPAVTHLLLPVPSFDENGFVKGGGSPDAILGSLSKDVTVIGGNLQRLEHYKTFDLLQDPVYVAQNAYITAHCAVQLAMEHLPILLRGCRVLVIGWGRIGKCLAALLKGMGADVTVAARKENDRAILSALGYSTADTIALSSKDYRVIFNTVPVMVLPESPPGILKIDLASLPGMGGGDVIHARGLPGQMAPEASGELIAHSILHKEGLL